MGFPADGQTYTRYEHGACISEHATEDRARFDRDA